MTSRRGRSAPDVDRFRYTARSDEVFTTTTLVRITDADGASGIGALRLRHVRRPGPGAARDPATDRAAADRARRRRPRARRGAADRGRHVAVPARGALHDRHRPVGPRGPARRPHAAARLSAVAPGAPSLPSYASVPLLDDEAAYSRRSSDLIAQAVQRGEAARVGGPRARRRASSASVRAGVPRPDPDARRGRPLRPRRAPSSSPEPAPTSALRWFEAPLPDFDLDGVPGAAPGRARRADPRRR